MRDARFQDGDAVDAEAVVRSLAAAQDASPRPRVLSDVQLTAEAEGSAPSGSPRTRPIRCCPSASPAPRSRSSRRGRTRRARRAAR
ncbi:hypothetical protein ACFQVA_22945 [Actinomadura keratinilytica]